MMKNFAFYENYIQTHFTKQDCGIDLKQIGKKTQEIYLSAVSIGQSHFYFEVRNRIKSIVDFLENSYSQKPPRQITRPLWYRINVSDQAINHYNGIGYLNMESDWLKFIIDYLETDRADQGGDTICVLFDLDFNWAICFTFSQKEKRLIIEKFQK